MENNRFSWCLVILVLCSNLLHAQEFPFSHYTPDNESVTLPSAEVYSVFQDDLGYIWFGIYSSGLFRYNGHKSRLYTDSDGLPAVTVYQVMHDKWGRLWVSTNAGLAVSKLPLQDYQGTENIEFVTAIGNRPLVSTSVLHNRMLSDRQGRVWVGTEEVGIVRYELPSIDSILIDTIPTDFHTPGVNEEVRSMIMRESGSVWIALGGGDMIIWAPGYGSDFRIVSDQYDPPA
ncbi:MAG: hypothetical protein OEQ53_17670, partial [Saprospiraceae bacterium]|nr:hypothetical protein [Saprospiraceae bacterium]